MSKCTVAFVLVTVTMVSAEIPRQRIHLLPKASLISPAPYAASGWRPAGQQFNLPTRTAQQPQQVYGPPPPAPSYGSPTEEPEVTTTELPITTTLKPQNVSQNQQKQKADLKSLGQEPDAEEVEKQEVEPQPQPQPQVAGHGQYYVVLPQAQNLVYQIPQTAAAFTAVPRANLVAHVPTVSSGVITPFSRSFVQIYQ